MVCLTAVESIFSAVFVLCISVEHMLFDPRATARADRIVVIFS